MGIVRKVMLGISAVSVMLQSSCVLPGIQEAVSNIDNFRVSAYADADTPHHLKVYRVGDAYYMELYLRFVPVSTRMFYYETITNSTKGVRISEPEEEYVARVPAQPYLVRLTEQDVWHILQRRVAPPGDDAPMYIPAKDFDYARAERCAVRPVKFIHPYEYDKKARYGSPGYYYTTEAYHTGTLHTLTRPLAWAAWGVEVPVFIASNVVFYTTYFPYRAVKCRLFGCKNLR